MTKDQLLENAKSLPAAERIDLAMELWAIIDADDLPLTDAQRRELDRRIAADEADSSTAEPWADLRARLLRGEL